MEGESAQRFAARLLERVRAEAPALDVALRWVEAEGRVSGRDGKRGDGACSDLPTENATCARRRRLGRGSASCTSCAKAAARRTTLPLALDRALAGLVVARRDGRWIAFCAGRARRRPAARGNALAASLCEAAVVSMGGQARLVVFLRKSGAGERG